MAYVEGRLETRKWTDKTGVEKYSTEIIANELQMLGGRSSSGSNTFEVVDKGAPASGGSNAPAGKPSGSGFDDFEDDIPF
jgi:single-strand DNA-binding protein